MRIPIGTPSTKRPVIVTMYSAMRISSQMISDASGKIYACKATVDMFHLSEDDFCPQMDRVLTVGDFYELSAGGQIIFT